MTPPKALWACALLLARTLFSTNMPTAAAQSSEAYDYIIVGGGTAGCAVAARLCEGLPDKSILLLERGAPRPPEVEAFTKTQAGTALLRSAIAPPALRNPTFLLAFNTTPNAELGGETRDILAGSTLGGSSVLAGGQWEEPSLEEVESWGVDGLDAAAARRLLRRAAEQLNPQVPPPELRQTYIEEHLAAYEALGFRETRGRGNSRRTGDRVYVNTLLAETSNGRKIDSATGYLAPVWPEGRCAANLNVVQGATVARVVTEDGVATGVEYSVSGSDDTVTATAAAEIVVSAGPYGTPQVLQLSGIGPRDVLERVGVPVVKDLPVGANTQARPLQGVLAALTAVPVAPENNSTALLAPEERAKFEAQEPSLLGVGVASILAPLSYGYTEATTRAILDTPTYLHLCVLDPQSRGSVKIASLDPRVPPIVNANFLAEQSDRDAAQQCLQLGRDLFAQWPQALGVVEAGPGVGPSTALVVNAYHFAAGAPVGAVLEGSLHVKGFENLRVVDSSVLPQVPRQAGPLSSIYMLAERCAELIIEAAPTASTRRTAASGGASAETTGSGVGSVRASDRGGAAVADARIEGRGPVSASARASGRRSASASASATSRG